MHRSMSIYTYTHLYMLMYSISYYMGIYFIYIQVRIYVYTLTLCFSCYLRMRHSGSRTCRMKRPGELWLRFRVWALASGFCARFEGGEGSISNLKLRFCKVSGPFGRLVHAEFIVSFSRTCCSPCRHDCSPAKPKAPMTRNAGMHSMTLMS